MRMSAERFKELLEITGHSIGQVSKALGITWGGVDSWTKKGVPESRVPSVLGFFSMTQIEDVAGSAPPSVLSRLISLMEEHELNAEDVSLLCGDSPSSRHIRDKIKDKKEFSRDHTNIILRVLAMEPAKIKEIKEGRLKKKREVQSKAAYLHHEKRKEQQPKEKSLQEKSLRAMFEKRERHVVMMSLVATCAEYTEVSIQEAEDALRLIMETLIRHDISPREFLAHFDEHRRKQLGPKSE